MPTETEPLQTDEVVKALTERQDCTLVHRDSGVQVDIYTDTYNQKAPWRIRYSHFEILDKTVLKQALALGFELCAHVGMRETRYELYRNCLGIRAAAIKALMLARLLPGVPQDAWLWATVYQYDDREEPPPEPPKPWPPAGT
jgi:hypothetical protein